MCPFAPTFILLRNLLKEGGPERQRENGDAGVRRDRDREGGRRPSRRRGGAPTVVHRGGRRAESDWGRAPQPSHLGGRRFRPRSAGAGHGAALEWYIKYFACV